MLLSILPGRIFVQVGEDAGAGGANEELAPRNFVSIFPNFPELELLVQLSQSVRQDMLAMVRFGHRSYDRIHFGFLAILRQKISLFSLFFLFFFFNYHSPTL